VDSTISYTSTVIAPERLILGVAFYGYDWDIERGPPARALRHSDVTPLISRVAAVPTLDPRSLSVTFRYEEEGERHEVWFEDSRSLEAKLALVGRYGLRGVGAWRLGQEDPEVWRVWDAAHKHRSRRRFQNNDRL
jgi:spore germination protein